jgi:hypothetical protein
MERTAESIRRFAIASLVAFLVLLVSSLTAAAGSADPPDCDVEGLSLPSGFCSVLVAGGLGPIRDLAVTDSGDVYVVGRHGAITAIRPAHDDNPTKTIRFVIENGIAVEAGYRSLFVATSEGVARYRLKEHLAPEVEPTSVVDGLAAPITGMELGRLGRLFVATGAACTEDCTDLVVHDALTRSPVEGRGLSGGLSVTDIRSRPGTDQLFGLEASRIIALGDHTGSCQPAIRNGCPTLGLGSDAAVSMAFTRGQQFPDHFRGGAFVATGAEAGILFVDFDDDGPVAVETFVDADAGPSWQPTHLQFGPDGSLYVAEGTVGRIWRILHAG